MATSGNENTLHCAICHELYTEPRKLPGCPHSYCESCIVNFVLELKNEEKLGSEFGCPVCKLPSNSPGPEESVQRWVTRLAVNEEIKLKCVAEIKREQSDTDNCCKVCLGHKKIVVANRFCYPCNENFCVTCSETIHSFSSNKGHLVVNRETEDQKVSDHFHEQAMEMLNNFTVCSKHPKEVVRFYCEDHNIFCCLICSVDRHKQCANVKPISSLAKECQAPDSTKLLELIAKLSEHIDSRVEAIKIDNEGNKEKAKQLDIEYQEMKKKVIAILDIMETNLHDEGAAAVKKAAMKTQDEIDDLGGLKRKLRLVRHLLESIVKGTSDDLAFVYIYELTQVVENIEKSIIKRGNCITTNGLEMTTTETFRLIQNLGPNETHELASISKPEATIDLPTYEDRPFLRKFNVKKTGTHKILPATFTEEEPLSPTYSGVLFLPENQTLLVDSYYGFCCLVNEQFVATDKWDMGDKVNLSPHGDDYFSNERHATYLGDKMVAVSIASQKLIVFISCNEHITEKVKMKCEYVPKALCALKNGDIAVAWDEPVAFGIISGHIWSCHGKVFPSEGGVGYCEKVYFCEDTSGRKLNSFRSMAVDQKRGHIIQPCDVDKAVYCFDLEGKHVFCYKNDAIQSPAGVAVDGEGNIFICESTLNSIHIISAEGIGITIIKESCPKYGPLAIGYNRSNNVFAVTVSDGEDDCPWEEIHFFSVSLK